MKRQHPLTRATIAVRRAARAVELRKERLLGLVVGAIPQSLHPNHVTWFRLLAVCPTLAASLLLGWPRWTTVAIAAAGFLSDGLDGTMARLRDQKTAVGATLDATADKLLVIPPLWILGFASIEPLIFWLLVARDVTIIGYTLVALRSRERLTVRSNRPGKWYMAIVFCLLLALLLGVPKLAADVVAGAAVVVGFISLPYYWRRDPGTAAT